MMLCQEKKLAAREQLIDRLKSELKELARQKQLSHWGAIGMAVASMIWWLYM